MKHATRNLLAVLALAGSAQPLTVHAQTGQSSPPAQTASATAADDWIPAEVRRVDAANARISLRHGEIKSLNMPPMTMVFGVRDAALLQELKVGDKVRFSAVDEGGGKLTVTALERTE